MMKTIEPWKIFPWILLSLVAIMMTLLGVRHRALREDFLEHRRADLRLRAGAYVPIFSGVSVQGDSLLVGQGSPNERQLIFVLTSACPFCRNTLPHWKEAAGRVSKLSPTKPRVHVMALTTDSMRTATIYAQSNRLPFPLVPFPSRRLASLYRAFSVPQRVVVDSDGRVLFARHGVINTQAALDSAVAAAVKPESPSTTAPVPGAPSKMPRADSGNLTHPGG